MSHGRGLQPILAPLLLATVLLFAAIVLDASAGSVRSQYAAAQLAIDKSSPESCTAAIEKAVALQELNDGPARSIAKTESEVLVSCFGAVLKPGSTRPFAASAYQCVGRSGTVTVHSESVVADTVPDARVVAGKCDVKVVTAVDFSGSPGDASAIDLAESRVPRVVSNMPVDYLSASYEDVSPINGANRSPEDGRVVHGVSGEYTDVSSSDRVHYLAESADDAPIVRERDALAVRERLETHRLYTGVTSGFDTESSDFYRNDHESSVAKHERSLPTATWDPTGAENSGLQSYFDLGPDAPESTNIEDRRNEPPPAESENTGPYKVPNNHPDAESTPEEQERIEADSGRLSPEGQKQAERVRWPFDEEESSDETQIAENKPDERLTVKPSCAPGYAADLNGNCYQKVTLEDIPRGQRPDTYAQEWELDRMRALGYACEKNYSGVYRCVETIPPEWLGKMPIQTTPVSDANSTVRASNDPTRYSSEYAQEVFTVEGSTQDLPTSMWAPQEGDNEFSEPTLSTDQDVVSEAQSDSFEVRDYGDQVNADSRTGDEYLPPLRTDAQGVPCDSFGADMSVCNDPGQRCSALGCFAVRSNSEQIDSLKQSGYICADDESPQGTYVSCYKPVENPDMPLLPRRTDASGIPCNTQGADGEACSSLREACSKEYGCVVYPSSSADEASLKKKNYICSYSEADPFVTCHKPLAGDMGMSEVPTGRDPLFKNIPSSQWNTAIQCREKTALSFITAGSYRGAMRLCEPATVLRNPEFQM